MDTCDDLAADDERKQKFQDEVTFLSIWQQERELELERRRNQEKEQEKKIIETAKENIINFETERAKRIENMKRQNRENEKDLRDDFNALFKYGTIWQQIGKMVDLNESSSISISKDIQQITDGFEKHDVSDEDIKAFLSFINKNAFNYTKIIDDISNKSQSKLLQFLRDELKNIKLFDILVEIIEDTIKSCLARKKIELKYKSVQFRWDEWNTVQDDVWQKQMYEAQMNAAAKNMLGGRLMLSGPGILYGGGYSMGSQFDGGNDLNIGLSVGGAKDVNNFRKCIEKNVMPSIDSITYNGLLSEYYFDTTTTKHAMEDKKIDINDESMLFYPSYCYAKTKKLIFNEDNKLENDDNNDDKEYYMTVGLNSNIKQSDFKRKHLNLVILLDKSGSMRYCFDFDIHSDSKMKAANKATISIIQHLTSKDRLGIVTFDSDATILQKMDFVEDIDLDILERNILNVQADYGTDFDIATNIAVKLFNDNQDSINNEEYDNRMIIITDAQPNDDGTSLNTVKKCAENSMNRIYTTFIGVGLDFNSSLIEKISKTRGCNYYSVKSNKDFENKMKEEFEYMVTPLVFNVCLRLKCEGNSCQIDKVYGSNNNILKNGEITKIDTLFPSKKSTEKGGTKGGIQLIKLKKSNTNNDNINVELEVTFEDRNGKKYKNTQNVSFNPPKEMHQNDMIQVDEKEEDELNINFYDNVGIRKAILLCKYVDLIKQWIKYNNNNNNNNLEMDNKYKIIFIKFVQHFKKEMVQCNDEELQKELDIIDKLIKSN